MIEATIPIFEARPPSRLTLYPALKPPSPFALSTVYYIGGVYFPTLEIDTNGHGTYSKRNEDVTRPDGTPLDDCYRVFYTPAAPPRVQRLVFIPSQFYAKSVSTFSFLVSFLSLFFPFSLFTYHFP